MTHTPHPARREPSPDPEADASPAEPDPIRVVVTRDKLGRPAEAFYTSDFAAAIHWHDEHWRPLR